MNIYTAYMTKAEGRYLNQLTHDFYITDREIWKRAENKAAARKATQEGVNHICIDNHDGKFYIFQVSGHTPEKGIFCYLLDEAGRITA